MYFLLNIYIIIICLPLINLFYYLAKKLFYYLAKKLVNKKNKRYTVVINPPFLRQLFRESVFKNHSFFELAFMNINQLLTCGKHEFNVELLSEFHNKNPHVDILTYGASYFYKLSYIKTINYINFINGFNGDNYIPAETTEQLVLDFILYGGILFIKECELGGLSENEVRTLISNIKNRNKKVTTLTDYKIVTDTEDLSDIVKSEILDEVFDEFSNSSLGYVKILNYIVQSVSSMNKSEFESDEDTANYIRFKYCRSNVSVNVFYKKSRPSDFRVANPQIRKEVIENNIDLDKIRI